MEAHAQARAALDSSNKSQWQRWGQAGHRYERTWTQTRKPNTPARKRIPL